MGDGEGGKRFGGTAAPPYPSLAPSLNAGKKVSLMTSQARFIFNLRVNNIQYFEMTVIIQSVPGLLHVCEFRRTFQA